MITLLLHLLRLLPVLCGGHRQVDPENLALRHQLTVYKKTVNRPKLCSSDRRSRRGTAIDHASGQGVRRRDLFDGRTTLDGVEAIRVDELDALSAILARNTVVSVVVGISALFSA